MTTTDTFPASAPTLPAGRDWHGTDCGLCGKPLCWEPTDTVRIRVWCGCADGDGTTLADIGFEYAVHLGADGLVYGAERDLDELLD